MQKINKITTQRTEDFFCLFLPAFDYGKKKTNVLKSQQIDQ